MKRTATPEQRERAQARRAAFRQLAQKVAHMSEDERAALAARHAVVTVEGHALTPHNACLILSQRPGATVVAGFRQWKRAGRTVRKGERGLALWVPTGTRDRNGTAPALETAEGERRGFVIGTVFDVTQTEPLD